MLPPFTPSGLLPPLPDRQPYRCSAGEVRQRFVEELGAPAWRSALLEGWELLATTVGVLVPSSRWWLWGCFVSNHQTPLFGDAETLNAVVFLPQADLPAARTEQAMLMGVIHSSQEHHRVDTRLVVEYPEHHPAYADTAGAITKWQAQARVNIADHATKEPVEAGFLEVRL